MVELYLIRHGKTYGNTLGRYIGTTDESLCAEGREAICRGRYPKVEAVFASPLKRCAETAQLIWPALPVSFCEELRECDFGDFENKNYQELNGNPDYQAWVDSGGTLSFPGGESQEVFRRRCCEGFRKILEEIRIRGIQKAALVVHGGTIMSILEAYAVPQESFYHWQVKNGQGYRTFWKECTEEEVQLVNTRLLETGVTS